MVMDLQVSDHHDLAVKCVPQDMLFGIWLRYLSSLSVRVVHWASVVVQFFGGQLMGVFENVGSPSHHGLTYTKSWSSMTTG